MSKGPRAPAARRDWGSDDTGCTVLHVDMDAFFAAVELLRRPDLRGKPVFVGGERRGVVLSATYEARASGVRAAMPVAQARALCPDAVVLPPDHASYSRVSRQVMGILAEITPALEKVSVDEAYLDVVGSLRRLGPPTAIARAVRERVRRETGVPASVGVAATKLAAKLASTHAKPDGLLLVPRAATVAFLHTLPVGALPGVGDRTEETLHRHGIDTVADLAARDVRSLHRVLGVAAGERLSDLAAGIDPRPVLPGRTEKSVGTETTFDEDVTDRGTLSAVLLDAAHRCAVRLRADEMLTRTVTIKVRYADFRTITRSRTVDPTDVAHDLFAAARDLLAGVEVPPSGVRLVGMRAENLAPARTTGVQDRLGATGARRGAEAAMDGVRARYGEHALGPASLLDQDGRRG